jgi:hypothetical protein
MLATVPHDPPHPGGPEMTPMPERVWICHECGHVRTTDGCEEGKWGRACAAHPKSKKPWRCEAYGEWYVSEGPSARGEMFVPTPEAPK